MIPPRSLREERVLRLAVTDPVEVVREPRLEVGVGAVTVSASCPMWETSKTPAPVRTARCPSVTDVYCTGISQPAKSTILAPSATWRS